MIIASLNDSEQYESLHPGFREAFAYLRQHDLSLVPAGKIELDGQKLFISVVDTTLKAADEARLETHVRYIDIQVPVSSPETMGYRPAGECLNSADGYNVEKDITFYAEKPSAYIQVEPGQFILFFPHDGHAPCIGAGAIRKAIVKVLVE